jgi:hypothetical protein
MHNLFDVHTKTNRLEKLLSHGNWISKCLCADDRPGKLISDTENQIAAPLVGKGDAILVQLSVIELRLRFLEFKALALGGRSTPQVNLFRRNWHSRVASPVRSSLADVRPPPVRCMYEV